MGARTKLNAAYLNGALIMAVVIGLSCNSWNAFVVTAVVLTVLSACIGNIRGSFSRHALPQDNHRDNTQLEKEATCP